MDPNDLTIVPTLSEKALEVIFFPGTWKGLKTASTYAAWNRLKNWGKRCKSIRIAMSNNFTLISITEMKFDDKQILFSCSSERTIACVHKGYLFIHATGILHCNSKRSNLDNERIKYFFEI